jgi:hypothetical protein
VKEIRGSLWSHHNQKGYLILITTNGTIRKDGCGVMGRGCALEGAQRYSDLPKLLGESLKNSGNVIQLLFPEGSKNPILTFPVKHQWFEDADPELIHQSALELKKIAEKVTHIKFILPRPGCGNGRLKWQDVKPLLEDLPDNVLVISPY